MIKDKKGQLSLEFILIFAISLIILTIFTIPLSEIAIGNTLEIADIANTKSDVTKIANGISEVYSQGQGSKKTIHIDSNRNYILKISPKSISTTLTLENGDTKTIKSSHNYNNINTNINIEKGKNKIIINWKENLDYLTVQK